MNTVVGAIRSLIIAVFSFIWQIISLTLRIVLIVLVLGTTVVALSYLPQVRASVPVAKDVPQIAKQLLISAGRAGAKSLASLVNSRNKDDPKRPTAAPRVTSPRRRPTQTAATIPMSAPSRPAATGPVTIRSTPTGATVQLNGRPMGKTPLTLKVAMGTHKVTISRPGYSTITRTVTVRAGKSASLTVKLTKTRRTPPRPTPAPVPPPKHPAPREP